MRLLVRFAFAAATLLQAENLASTAPSPVYHGETVTVNSAPLSAGTPPQSVLITLTLAGSNKVITLPPMPPITQDSFSFPVPDDQFGIWTIAASQSGSDIAIKSPKRIEIKAKAPQIDTVAPKVLYGAKSGEACDFTVIGSGFTESPDAYKLNFLDDQSPNPSNYKVRVSSDGHQLTFSGVVLPGRFGRKRLNVAVDGATSNNEEISFSNVKENTPRVWALAMLAGIIVLIYFLLRAGKREFDPSTNDRQYFLTALFLDKETNTYSLSQCQFYAWTAAAILGYIYLATAKSMIQGSLAFPDIPTGLPGILLVSAGTTVIAAGIAGAKGNKGSGEIHPSLSDFITTGGVVAAERLQFVSIGSRDN